MNATDKKKAERYFVEHIQRYHPGFLPDVSPRDFEGPDFLIEQADGSLLGLEVTQLFHPREGRAFPELQVAQFHRDIVRLAGEIHQAQHPERPVDVATYYDRGVRLRDLGTCAQRLADYVATVDDGTTGMTPMSPEGLRGCFAAPPEITQWRFSFDFDRPSSDRPPSCAARRVTSRRERASEARPGSLSNRPEATRGELRFWRP